MIQLYSLRSYDRAAKVRWLLTELGEKFEDIRLDRDRGEHETPAFLKLNPMGRVPTLVVDGRAMFESGAICTYLADLHPEKGLAPALDSPLRMDYLQWMYFASSTVDVFQTRIMVIEDIPAGEYQKKKERALFEEHRDACAALDHVLSRSEFLVGDRFTSADICVSYHLYLLALWPELDVVTQDFPSIVKYVERMKARPSAVRADVFSYRSS